MTSNQLSYWKLQEEKRANRASEGLKDFANRETKRSNLVNESIKQVQNALESRGLDIKDKQLMNQLAEIYMTQGAPAWSQLPDSLQNQIADAFKASGLRSDSRSATFSDVVSDLYHEIMSIFKNGGAKIISALF